MTYLDDINDIFPWIPRGEYKRTDKDAVIDNEVSTTVKGGCNYDPIHYDYE